MSSMNRVILIGRVARVPELRRTGGGKAVANFALAVDRRRGGGDQETDFIPIVVWERLAEICEKYLTTGKLIAIEGRLQVREYETREGDRRKAYEVVANEMQMLGKGGGTGDSGEAPPPDDYDVPF